MKSVLYIGADTPWSGGAGYLVRQDGFLRALAEVANLHLALFDTGNFSAAPPPFACDEVTRLPLPPYTAEGRWGRAMADVYSPRPRMFRGHPAHPARPLVRRILESRKFDAIFAYRIDFAHFAGVLDRQDLPPLLLDVDDPEHVRGLRRIKATTGRKGDVRTRWDLRKLRRFEMRAVANAAASFVCQEHDRVALGNVPLIAPNCVDVPEPAPPRRDGRADAPPAAPKVLFVGNFTGGSKTPNTDGLEWLFEHIWPAVLHAVPGAELHVIGRASDKARARLQNPPPGVRAPGFVDSLDDAYATAALSVAPIRFGTGTRVKILESFAHGCPVVSTPIGCEGIDAADDREVMLAPTAADFAACCVRLLTDPALRERLGRAGRELVAARYNRRLQHERLVEEFRRLLQVEDAGAADGVKIKSPPKAPAAVL